MDSIPVRHDTGIGVRKKEHKNGAAVVFQNDAGVLEKWIASR
jgi:hypothetical protein